MKATAQIENPGDIDVTLTVTMPLRSWQSPAADLRVKISRVAHSMEEKVLLKDDE